MENKTASLHDVDIKSVTLKQLVDFIESMRSEYPIAIRVLAKRLLAQEYGIVDPSDLTEAYPFDDAKVIESLVHLKDDISDQAKGEAATAFVLSLHSTFGFGRKRVLRLWDEAMALSNGDAPPSVDDLVKWCERRGIDYDEVFGYQTQAAPSIDSDHVMSEVTNVGD